MVITLMIKPCWCHRLLLLITNKNRIVKHLSQTSRYMWWWWVWIEFWYQFVLDMIMWHMWLSILKTKNGCSSSANFRMWFKMRLYFVISRLIRPTASLAMLTFTLYGLKRISWSLTLPNALKDNNENWVWPDPLLDVSFFRYSPQKHPETIWLIYLDMVFVCSRVN